MSLSRNNRFHAPHRTTLPWMSQVNYYRKVFGKALSGTRLDHSRSERRPPQGNDELDAVNVPALEPFVVRDEEINLRACSTGQLNGVGRLERPLRSQRRIELGRFHVESNDGRGGRNDVLVSSAKLSLSPLYRFNQNLTQRKRGRKQLIASVQHPGAKLAHGL